MFPIFAPHAADFYKTGHPFMFPKGVSMLAGNFTPRGDKHARMLPDFQHKVVWFGEGMIQSLLIDAWNESFFQKPKEAVIRKYRRRMDKSIGPGKVPTDKFAALHDLGYLPVEVRTLPEGARVNMRVSPFTIKSTHPDFAWVEQYLETQISAEMWKPMTTATAAFEYKRLFLKYAKLTGVDLSYADYQGHNFADRGMSGIWDAAANGAAHLTSFKGTDSISGIDYVEDYFLTDEDDPIGVSIPATEHAVSSSNIILMADNLERTGYTHGWSVFDLNPTDSPLVDPMLIAETAFMKHMLLNLYPEGLFSYVADTYDFFAVIAQIAPFLKKDILSRNGKIVFRPDSGDPYHVLCGYKVDSIDDLWGGSEAVRWTDGKVYTVKPTEENRIGYGPDKELSEWEIKGAVEILYENFPGATTSLGFKQLDDHVGLIYGDSITLDLAARILARLYKKGFASNVSVFGIGSFTFQFVTRDSFGTAMKATYMEITDSVTGEVRRYALFKDPKTDRAAGGIKKSARGLLRVEKVGDDYIQFDGQTLEQEELGALEVVMRNSTMVRRTPFNVIRERLQADQLGLLNDINATAYQEELEDAA